MIDDDLNVVGMIDWQAFGPSLVAAERKELFEGVSTVTRHDRALARFLEKITGSDEKLRRFFFGLDADLSCGETLYMIRGI